MFGKKKKEGGSNKKKKRKKNVFFYIYNQPIKIFLEAILSLVSGRVEAFILDEVKM